MEKNPYAVPRARVDDPETSDETGELASRGQRFLNMLIDVFGYFAMSMLIGAVLGLVYPAGVAALSRMGTLGNYLFGILVMTAYYLPLEALSGRTLGKLVTRTRVVTEEGETASFAQLLGRTAARFIPFEVFSFFGRDAVGWHDKLSGTRVVRLSRR